MSRFVLSAILAFCLIPSTWAANPIEEENQKPAHSTGN